MIRFKLGPLDIDMSTEDFMGFVGTIVVGSVIMWIAFLMGIYQVWIK